MADRPTFYVDRCLGKALPAALRNAGACVEIHDDHFSQNALDVNWIPEVTRRGWVILTKDKNIRRNTVEREVVLTASARIFTLSSGNMRGAEMADRFVRYLADMEQFAVNEPAPFVAVLEVGGIRVVLRRPSTAAATAVAPTEAGTSQSGDDSSE